jgi:hypothetical protein
MQYTDVGETKASKGQRNLYFAMNQMFVKWAELEKDDNI